MGPDPVAYAYISSYLGEWSRSIASSMTAWETYGDSVSKFKKKS